MQTQTRKKAAAFTLTEVVIASTLLVITIVPILKALTTANHNNAIIEMKTRSLVLAEAKLDKIRASSIYSYDDSFSENNTTLESHYLCNVVDTSVSDDLREINVSVGYDLDANNSLAADEIQVSLVTYVAKRW